MCVATDGTHLANLVVDAAASCKAAFEQLDDRSGPGRPDTYKQWQIAVLIFIAIAHGRKSKSSQYRFLKEHQSILIDDLGLTLELEKLPSYATYMRRYNLVHPLLEKAIELGGQKAIKENVGDARIVSVDKSMIAARGRKPSKFPNASKRGLDTQAGWGRSAHDGWVWGYSYEVVVCSGKDGLILPLLASVSTASASEHRSFDSKISRLPRSTCYVLGDSAYDNNRFGEEIEFDRKGKRIRRFLTPMVTRGGKPAVGQTKHKGRRERERQHRIARAKYFESKPGRRLYRRRRETVEPFNDWFKERFELQERVWHYGLANNQTMLLAGLFIYQTLQRYNARLGHKDGSIQWILDAL